MLPQDDQDVLKKQTALAQLSKRLEFREMRDVNEGARASFKAIRISPKPSYDQPHPLSASGEARKNLKESNDAQTKENELPQPQTILFSPHQLQFHWSQMSRIGPGLVNAGNTCFLNATLQCLLYTPPFVQYLLAKGRQIGFCTLCEMEKLSRQMIQEKQSDAPKYPLALIKGLRAIAKHMKPGRQEDAHEFLCHLMDAMQRNCLAGLPVDLEPSVKQTTFINQIFGGFLCSIVKCSECHGESITYDPIQHLSLDIKNCDSIEKALSLFIRPDTLSGKDCYKCEKCMKKVKAIKYFRIAQPPNMLTIQLKRFQFGLFGGGKINRPVYYPDVLDLKPFVATKEKNASFVYKLYAVLVHAGGSTKSGHYYSYVKSPVGVWYEMDDASVSQVKLDTVLRQNAYLLFYTREGTGPSRDRPQAPSKSATQPMPQFKTPPPTKRVTSIPTPPASPLLEKAAVQEQVLVGDPTGMCHKMKEILNEDNRESSKSNRLPSPESVTHSPSRPPQTSAPSTNAPHRPLNASPLAYQSVHSGPIVSWDEKLPGKKAKLAEVIQRERQNFDKKLTILDGIMESKPLPKWDDSVPVVSIASAAKKPKRPSYNDLEYDRGRTKKIRKDRWLVFEAQKDFNPFTSVQEKKNRETKVKCK